MTARSKRLLFFGLDLSGLFVAWAVFGTRYLPYFTVAFLVVYLLWFTWSRP